MSTPTTELAARWDLALAADREAGQITLPQNWYCVPRFPSRFPAAKRLGLEFTLRGPGRP